MRRAMWACWACGNGPPWRVEPSTSSPPADPAQPCSCAYRSRRSQSSQWRHMKKIRVLLADDHSIMREGLMLRINSQRDMHVVAEAANGREACQRARALKPDVVVLDLSMPEMSGLKA